MPLTDDPIADFNRLDQKQAEWLKQLPECERCGHPIQQEWAVCIDDFWYCDDCIEYSKKVVIPYE